MIGVFFLTQSNIIDMGISLLQINRNGICLSNNSFQDGREVHL